MTRDDTINVLRANLEALPAATRHALEAAEDSAPVDLSAGFASACVKTPVGRWTRVHNSPSPGASAEGLVAKLASGNPPVVIVIGLGLGYLLDALEERTSIKVLAVEPVPSLVRAMLSRRDWTSWLRSGRLTLLVGPDYPGSTDAWKLLTNGATSAPVIATPLMEREFASATVGAKATVKHILAGARANDEARELFAGRYLLNTLTNLPVIVAEGDAATLANVLHNVPAVVVGAGPSLDANVADLRSIQDSAAIIAVDTAVKPLLAGGVRPHLVVAVDPSELNARHLDDLTDTAGIWLVAEGSIDPSVLPPFKGRTFVFKVSGHHPWPWLAAQGLDRGRLQAWGSVLTTAFDLACEAGCDPVIFAGADLAYTGGALYATNTTFEAEWKGLDAEARRQSHAELLLLKSTFSAPDVQGVEVTTSTPFVQFRDWLVAQSVSRSNTNIINATGAGILHGGRIEQATLSSLAPAIVASGARDVRAAIRAAWSNDRDTRETARLNLVRALASHQRSAPVDQWLAFGGATTSRPEIVAALDAAAEGRHVMRPRAPAPVPPPVSPSPLPGVLQVPEKHGVTTILATDPLSVVTPASLGAFAIWFALEPILLDSEGRLRQPARFTLDLSVVRGRIGVGWMGETLTYIEEVFTSESDALVVLTVNAGVAPGHLVIRNGTDAGPSEFILRGIRCER